MMMTDNEIDDNDDDDDDDEKKVKVDLDRKTNEREKVHILFFLAREVKSDWSKLLTSTYKKVAGVSNRL